jgi:hypothetical protein
MKRIILFGLSGIIGTSALTQCSFTVSSEFHMTCADWPNTYATVTVSGGTAPYQIVIEKFLPWNGSYVWTAQTSTSASSTNISLAYLDWIDRDQARVRVTDAGNCTVEQIRNFTSIGYRAFTLGQYVDCATGLTYARVSISGMPNLQSPAWSYNWDFGANMPFASNWTLIGTVQSGQPANYRSNSPITSGFHTLLFPQFNWFSFQWCEDFTNYTFLDVTPGDCGVNFRLRAALDGALPTGTLMSDGLRAANLIPLTQPYTGLGYNYVGSPTNMTIPASMLTVTGNDAIVDWVVVELRSNTTTVVYSKPALLQRDGDVIDTDGNTYLNFPVTAGSYYVALRHRNHLGVMTSTARSLGVDPSAQLIDFRSSTSGAYGTTPLVLKGTVYCLWSGDGNGNGTLQYVGIGNDRDPILTAVGGTTPNNTLGPVYDRRDVNLDGVVKYVGANNDRDPILTNVGSTTPNNTRIQQLP